MQKVDLKVVISDISNEFVSLTNEKGLYLETVENNMPTEIVCDEYKIGQVIRNLLSNAVKFTPKGKRICLSIEPASFKGNTSQETVEAIQVNISDQGIGLPEGELENIFDKFVRSTKTKTKAGGTGLGLAICREIIFGYNGKIWAESNPKGGSVFSFYDSI